MNKILLPVLVFFIMTLAVFSCVWVDCPLNTTYNSAKDLCVPLKKALPCNDYTERVPCIENNYCSWSEGVCIDKRVAVMPGIPDPVTPGEVVPPGNLLCNDLAEKTVCETNYCEWNVDNSICQNSSSNCSTRVIERQCIQGGECLWDVDTNTCISPLWPCTGYLTNCPTSSGCEWYGYFCVAS